MDRSKPPFSETKGSRTIGRKGGACDDISLTLGKWKHSATSRGDAECDLGPRSSFLGFGLVWKGICVFGSTFPGFGLVFERHLCRRKASSSQSEEFLCSNLDCSEGRSEVAIPKLSHRFILRGEHSTGTETEPSGHRWCRA
jgi:hypothetical protein